MLHWVLNCIHWCLEGGGNVWTHLAINHWYTSGWVCKKNFDTSWGKQPKHVHELCVYVGFLSRMCTSAVAICSSFAQQLLLTLRHCFVWSLLPLHSANAVFLLSVTLKPLWSTVYSHSFGTLCPSSAAATQWLNERRFRSTSILRSSSSDWTLFWNNCSLEQKRPDSLGKCLSQSGKVEKRSLLLFSLRHLDSIRSP